MGGVAISQRAASSDALLDARKLAKVFMVVGLGMLSLYLLKRRFSL